MGREKVTPGMQQAPRPKLCSLSVLLHPLSLLRANEEQLQGPLNTGQVHKTVLSLPDAAS